VCDERDSQLSNGWLRKVGVLDFPLAERWRAVKAGPLDGVGATARPVAAGRAGQPSGSPLAPAAYPGAGRLSGYPAAGLPRSRVCSWGGG